MYKYKYRCIYILFMFVHRFVYVYLYCLEGCVGVYLFLPVSGPSVRLSYLPTKDLAIYLSLHMYIHLSNYPSMVLSIYVSIYRSIYPYLSSYLSSIFPIYPLYLIDLSIRLFTHRFKPAYQSAYPSTHRPICLWDRSSTHMRVYTQLCT